MKSPAYGLPNLIPDDAVAYFGCRAILKNGIVDILLDRKDCSFNDEKSKKQFATWFEKQLKPRGWITKEAKLCYGNEDKLHSFDDGKFHIRMNTKASYGYLYITAWMDA